MPREEFAREVEKELTGQDSEPHEIIYFKIYKSQIPSGRTGSRNRSLDAGHGQIPRVLPGGDLRRFPRGSESRRGKSGNIVAVYSAVFQVPARRAEKRISGADESAGFVSSLRPKHPRLRLDSDSYKNLCRQIFRRDNWRYQICGACANLEVHHKNLRSQTGDDSEENLVTLCASCHAKLHRGQDDDRTNSSMKPRKER